MPTALNIPGENEDEMSVKVLEGNPRQLFPEANPHNRVRTENQDHITARDQVGFKPSTVSIPVWHALTQ